MTLLTKLINAVSTGCPACAGHDKLVRGVLPGPALLLAILIASGTANAAVPCRTSGSFDSWLTAFEREATAQGLSQRAVSAAAPGLTYNQPIVNIDRGQRVFTQTFLEFSDRMAAGYRIQTGAAKIKTYAQVFQRTDQQYGVPAPVIVAFWVLESDFGANMGKEHTLSALASLAYDCRRAERSRGQLLDALRLIDRGYLQPQDMIGSLVRVPASMPWDQADLAIQLPRSKWAVYGVTLADGRPLPADAMPTSLLLPVGRFGPAFLVYQNFQIYLQWNNSLVYSTTAAYLASRIAGAPPLHRGTPPPALPFNEVKEIQNLLVRAGYDVGTVDGFHGLKTRQTVKAMQMNHGLPADSYPTAELLARMRGGR